jgi:hypothetical protein
MTEEKNTVVQGMERFLDRLLDPSLTQADRLLYLNARALEMREALRFLALPESIQVDALQKEINLLRQVLGAIALEKGRPSQDGTIRFEVPSYRYSQAGKFQPAEVLHGYNPLIGGFGPTSVLRIEVRGKQ